MRRHLAVVCSIVWVAAFVTTHLPGGAVPRVGVKDTTLHFVGYFVIALLFLLTLSARGVPRLRRAVLVFCTMAAYGAIDEITQPLVRRSTDIRDWIADVAGTAVAIMVCESLSAIVGRRRRKAPTGAEL